MKHRFLSRQCTCWLTGVIAMFAVSCGGVAEVRVVGSSIVARAMTAAVPSLHESGIEISVKIEGGSSGGIAALGTEEADMAMAVRPLTAKDRALFPEKEMTDAVIGYQALALVVSRDVWMSGVRSLSREQAVRIYEREIKNWKELGGEDRPIHFYNPPQGKGVWEYFASWMYGDIRKAPLGEGFDTVTDSQDTRNSVEFNNGSLSVVPLQWIDWKETYALALIDGNGSPIPPTKENVQDRVYPLSRPLVLATSMRPAGDLRKIIEFMRAPAGQGIVKKCDLLPIVDPQQ